MYDASLSHFDIDYKRGAQGEIFVSNIRDMLASGSGSIEVKADSWAIKTGRFYVETECRGRDGKWRASGISVTRATFWAFTFGKHPMMVVLDTDWLRRAKELAAQNPSNHAECKYGQNPTRGIYVTSYHLKQTRDESKDEH